MSLTLVEKIDSNHTVGIPQGKAARQGQIVRVRPKHVMTHDNTGAVIPKFLSIFEGTEQEPKMADPRQPVFAIDHDIQNTSTTNREKYAKIERFSHDHGVDFYPAGTGISHQIMSGKTAARSPNASTSPKAIPETRWRRRKSA